LARQFSATREKEEVSPMPLDSLEFRTSLQKLLVGLIVILVRGRRIHSGALKRKCVEALQIVLSVIDSKLEAK
jgi:hypothetical protein